MEMTQRQLQVCAGLAGDRFPIKHLPFSRCAEDEGKGDAASAEVRRE